MKLAEKFLDVGDVIKADASWEIVNDYPGHKGPKDLNQVFNYYSAKGKSLDAPTIGVASDKRAVKKKSEDAPEFAPEFVVIKTQMTGGGTGHGPHDIYPDGHEVTIRQLKKDGTYDDKGQDYRFYQSGAFNCMITEVTPTRKMKMGFS